MTRWAALCIPLLASLHASAGETPLIAVVGAHLPDVHAEGQAELAGALASTIAKTGRARAVHGSSVGLHIAGRQQVILEEALLSEGRALLAEGRNLYNQALPADAIPVLRQAIERLEDGVLGGDLRDLWEAHLALGTCAAAEGDDEGAARAFRDAIALNPKRAPDPALYPPDVVARYDAVRAESLARTASIEVRAPVGHALSIDGVEVGRTPWTQAGLLPGTHHLRAVAPGSLARARISLDGEPLSVSLDARPPTLAGGGATEAAQARQIGALYRAFGRHTEGVDYVLLTGTTGSFVHLQLYDVRGDTFSRATSVPFAGDAADEARQTLPLLLNLLDDGGRLPAANTQPGAVALDRSANAPLAALLTEPIDLVVSPPRKRRTALWVGLGAGLVAAAGAGTAAALTSGPRYDGTVIIGPF